MVSEPLKPSTLALHAGDDDRTAGAPLGNPLIPATSFYADPGAIGFSANELTDAAPHFYARWSHPATDMLEARLAALEGGEAALSFASGMAAVTGLFLTKLQAGDHLVLSNVCYAGVAELAQEMLPKLGIAVTTVDESDAAAVAAALRPNTKLVHIETPANPILRLADISALAQIAHARGAALSVDSTMATPIATQPLALGADYVVHSLTKYICGHGDTLGGAVIGRKASIEEMRKRAGIHFGATLNPFAAWLLLRGLETLSARMALHQANAAALVTFLESHPRVKSVIWPGSPHHPQHALALRQMKNFSGMVVFTADDGPALARQLAARMKVVSYAVSLGKTRSLIFYIPSEDILKSSFRLDGAEAEKYRAVAGEGVFRLSVGLEDASDLIADISQALK